MIGYITLGTNDFDRAAHFYDALFKIMGIGRTMDYDTYIAWGNMDEGQAGFSIIKPHNGQPATVGNGVMIGLAAASKEEVEKVHAKALELGGVDEGAVGPRDGMTGFYVGYFRDLDGNKLNVHHISMEDLKGAMNS